MQLNFRFKNIILSLENEFDLNLILKRILSF